MAAATLAVAHTPKGTAPAHPEQGPMRARPARGWSLAPNNATEPCEKVSGTRVPAGAVARVGYRTPRETTLTARHGRPAGVGGICERDGVGGRGFSHLSRCCTLECLYVGVLKFKQYSTIRFIFFFFEFTKNVSVRVQTLSFCFMRHILFSFFIKINNYS